MSKYVPKMERKVAEPQQLLKSSVNNNLEIVVMGNFNTFTLTLAARLPADSISNHGSFQIQICG